jgi:hypothetical protein
MVRRRLIAVLLSAGLLGSLPRAAIGEPTPRAAPTVLCQTLHQAVQPALAEVMNDDTLLEAASRSFVSEENDRPVLREVAASLTHNLDTIAQLLGREFPQDANATAHASEQLMKLRLQAVASAQNDALNLIEGHMQIQDIARGPDESVEQPGANDAGGAFSEDQSMRGADFHDTRDPAKPFVAAQSASPIALLQTMQARIGNLEDAAGIAIMSAVQICNSH